jgi:SAM-dependent methyltransferase
MCPACQSRRTRLLKRKHVVTALYRCDKCELMFRVPKNSPVEDQAFYQDAYEQQSTTELPDLPTLQRLKQGAFLEMGKHYGTYIQILEAVRVPRGATVYDYGASWGYGSWQFAQAGYRVYSYEISRARARYAEEYLGCHMVPQPTEVPDHVDCLFACHVLEHLATPEILWEVAAQVLKPDGVVILSVPNGEPCREQSDPRGFHQLWGRVHPLLLTYRAVEAMAARHGFTALGYSSPLEPEHIARGTGGQLEGAELLVVARQVGAPR